MIKKSFIVLILISIALCGNIGVEQVFGEGNNMYFRVIDEETYLYRDENLTEPLFVLPYTYYVKAINVNGETTYAECIASENEVIDGYIKTEKLYKDELQVNSPYPNIKIKTADTGILYSDKTLNKTIQYVFADRTLTYFGKLPLDDGTILYYVSYNNKLGYIKESAIVPFSIANHPNELTFIKEENIAPILEKVDEGENSNTESPTNSSTTLRIIIVICLAFAGITAMFLVFKEKPKKTPPSYYDENNYE